MEWFSRSDVDNLVVAKGVDGFPSFTDSWSQWDATPFGNFKPEMKRNNIKSSGCGVINDVDMKNFGMQEGPFDNEAIGQHFHCDMDQWSSYPPQQLEFHLDNMASIDQLDDVFLSSLLEEGPTGMDASDESSDMSASSQCRDENSNPEHATSKASSGGSAKYFSAHAFTSPVDWESQEVNNSHLLEKAPPPEVTVKLKHGRGDIRASDGEISMDESVLQHLENLTTQLTDQTRICFRDALYRLADNSKQDACQSGNVMPDQTSTWLYKEETTELRTNVIDRTVANLLFSNIEFGVSEDSSMDLTEATNIQLQYSGGTLWNSSCSSGCDAPTSSV